MSTDKTAISMSHQISESRLRALIAQWRENTKQADRLAFDYDQKRDGANSHASRQERRIWMVCADELEAALAEGVPSAEPLLIHDVVKAVIEHMNGHEPGHSGVVWSCPHRMCARLRESSSVPPARKVARSSSAKNPYAVGMAAAKKAAAKRRRKR